MAALRPSGSSLLISARPSLLARSPAVLSQTRAFADAAAPPPAKLSASSPSKVGGRTRARYQFRAPRYYRGPLHPIQPPKPSAPNSREFVPGPFGRERLEDHYHTTLAPDLLTLTYTHQPPSVPKRTRDITDRLREWDESSPYHKGRPLRGPRGGDVLRLLTPPRTFRNVPTLTGVTVHAMVKHAIEDNAHLAVAGMVVQSITGVRAQVGYAKANIGGWGLKIGQPVSVKAHMEGQLAWRFMASLVDVVMPRVKEYKGVRGSTGDSSGNITFGFRPSAMAHFPEIEVNYDMYPPKMIPGIHVTVHTSARNDSDGRKLLQGFGIPFYGKFID